MGKLCRCWTTDRPNESKTIDVSMDAHRLLLLPLISARKKKERIARRAGREKPADPLNYSVKRK